MVPGFTDYLDGMPPVTVDGGYYTKVNFVHSVYSMSIVTQVPDNMPMIGCVPQKDQGQISGNVVDGAFMCACLSGYGIMVRKLASRVHVNLC